jgi:hypothetical protein
MFRSGRLTQQKEQNMSTAFETVSAINHGYSYGGTLDAAQRVNWKIADIIGGDKRLDFSKPFMPESLARVEELPFLNKDEKRILNQIRGNAYLTIFGVVEEFILPFVLDHARPHLSGDDYRVRALLQFAGEEAKHIHLFKKFAEEFANGFPTKCAVIGPADAIGKAVLAHDPLAVAFAILQIEWMTQRHYIDSVQDDHQLDPQFKSLLKHHWMEEAQHAKLDTLMVEALAENRTAEQIDHAVDEYFDIGGFIAGGLQQQVRFDLEAFTRVTGRTLNEDEERAYVEVQTRANLWTYLGSGMTHPNFLNTLELLNPNARKRVEEAAPLFS